MKLLDVFVEKLFTYSSQPVKFVDLLEANALLKEKMPVDTAKLHFKYRHILMYFTYMSVCCAVLGPIFYIFHLYLQLLDFHIAILATVFATSLVFICFDAFKHFARLRVSQLLLRKAWELHFPFFDFDKYSNRAAQLYLEALEQKIDKGKLEQFILSKMVSES